MRAQMIAAAGAIWALAAAPWPAAAQDRLAPIEVAAACAPLPVALVPADSLAIIGVQDTVARVSASAGDLVIIGGGAGRGLALDQRFYVRRLPERQLYPTEGPRGASTAGWLRIVAVNETTAIGLVEFACDALLTGDRLQPYAAVPLPPGADRTDASGEPDFTAAGRVLFGDNERTTAGAGDFMVTDRGTDSGAASGSRFAIYRDVGVDGVPLASLGEAIVISVGPAHSVIRVTHARDAITAGDLVVPRRQPQN